MFSKSPVSVVELSGKSTVTKNTIKTEILKQALQQYLYKYAFSYYCYDHYFFNERVIV